MHAALDRNESHKTIYKLHFAYIIMKITQNNHSNN